ncbi:hypothetical protein ACCS69_33215, partial [Rhizobium johnstonii]|uniref:hypothetical protein n=1 Tax=Rhizobium johnstonii TaxID=3019933 RepID=UPI003F95AFF4
LGQKDFKRLVEICEKLGFSDLRDALNSCLPSDFCNVLPLSKIPKAQLILDLVKLNTTLCTRHPEEPFIPLKAWLDEARMYDGGAHEGLELSSLADKVTLVFQQYRGQFQQDHVERIRATLVENMRLLYVPFLTRELTDINVDAAALAKAVETSIDRRLRYDRKVYVKKLDRVIEVSWADSDHKDIRVRDISKFEFVPFTHEQIIWRTQRFPSGELTASQYRITRDKIGLKGSKIGKPKETQSTDGQVITSVYTLPLLATGMPYLVTTDREREWYLDGDPTFEQTSPYVVDGGRITIKNKAKGIRLVYHDVGGAELFLPADEADRCTHKWDVIRSDKEITLTSQQLLLPDQGYMIVISRCGDERSS